MLIHPTDFDRHICDKTGHPIPCPLICTRTHTHRSHCRRSFFFIYKKNTLPWLVAYFVSHGFHTLLFFFKGAENTSLFLPHWEKSWIFDAIITVCSHTVALGTGTLVFINQTPTGSPFCESPRQRAFESHIFSANRQDISASAEQRKNAFLVTKFAQKRVSIVHTRHFKGCKKKKGNTAF